MSSLRGFVVGGLACALLLALPLGAPAAESPEAARRQEIETVVREYLRAHPEVVTEALQEMERREQEAQRKRAAEAVRAHLAELTQDPGSPVGGNPQGTVTIVEFFDYQCGYCKGEAVELKKLLQVDPDIRFVYKDLPILGPVSTFAARAALAAQQQGKHEVLHAALMAASERLTEQGVLQIAAQVGLDAARLEKDMADPAVAETLARVARLGEALGIRGTPALIVGMELVPGAADLDALKRLVAQARKK
ncbi:MAG TPA: DsbA family protein [Candidatus Methylomirabilis sp.]